MWVPGYRPNRRWMLSRVGPTIHRGHRFVSYCTTVVVFFPRLLAVAVSQKKNAAPPQLYMSDKRVNIADLVYGK